MYKIIKKLTMAFMVFNFFMLQSAVADMLFYYSAAILPSIVATQKQSITEPFQIEKLAPYDLRRYDYFAKSVAMDGDYIVVGAEAQDKDSKDASNDEGAVYLYKIEADGIVRQIAKLTAGDRHKDDKFGHAVAISGKYIVVGAHQNDTGNKDAGSVYVFKINEENQNGVVQIAKIQADDGAGAGYESYFGCSVAIDGQHIVVGADHTVETYNDAGYAYVFKINNNDTVTQIAKMQSDDIYAWDYFGSAVAIEGDYIAVAATGVETGGKVYLFKLLANNSVSQLAGLQSADIESGDSFGASLSMYGDYIVVGAPGEDTNGSNAGATYVFKRTSDSSVTQLAKLQANDLESGDRFGTAVAIDSSTIMIGARSAGSAYIYTINSDSNISQNNTIHAYDAQSGASFGSAVAVSNRYLTVGAPQKSDRLPSAGAAYVFDLQAASKPYIYHFPASPLRYDEQYAKTLVHQFEGASPAGDHLTYTLGGTDAERFLLSDNNLSFKTVADYENPQDEGADNNYSISVTAKDAQNNTTTREFTISVQDRFFLELDRQKALDAPLYDRLGDAIASDGDYVVAGAKYRENDTGAAYLFKRLLDGSLKQVAKLQADDKAAGDYFGSSVAIYGDYIAVGAPRKDSSKGNVYLFKRVSDNENDTIQIAKIAASNPDTYAYFGSSLALYGQYLVVGSVNAHSAYLFKINSDARNDVTELKRFEAPAGEETYNFASAVALYEDRIVIGSPSEDSAANNAGCVYVYKRISDTNITQIEKITASDADVNDNFGKHISVTENYIAVLAPNKENSEGSIGNAYLFRVNSETHSTEVAKVALPVSETSPYHEEALSVNNSYLAVGVSWDDTGYTNAGAVYLYEINTDDTVALKEAIQANEAHEGDLFGSAVALTHDSLSVGSEHGSAGNIYLFKKDMNVDFSTTVEDFNGTVSEQAQTGDIVGYIRAGELGNSAITSITLSGPGSAYFEVLPNGTILVRGGAVFERDATYTLTATVTNAAGETTSITVGITVVTTSVPTLQDSSASVMENSAEGTVVGSVTIVNDGGAPITQMTLSGTGHENFAVNSAGKITVASAAQLDHETTPAYYLQAKARNSVGESDSVDVNISIVNVPETAPVLADSNLTIAETASEGTSVGHITIINEGDTAISSFTLRGPGEGNFTVDANGEVTIAAGATLDRETTPLYHLSATATNDFGESASVNVDINVSETRLSFYMENSIQEQIRSVYLSSTLSVTLSNDEHVAYVANHDKGLAIIDIGSAASPSLIKRVDTSGYAHDVVLAKDGNIAYVADSSFGLQVIDVSDPNTARIVGHLDTGYAFGIALSESNASQLFIADGRYGLKVIDVSDPAVPALLGAVDTAQIAYKVKVSADGTRAYIADRADGLVIIDISTPSAPFVLSNISTGSNAIDLVLSDDNRTAYVLTDFSGLKVIDISNDTSPQIIGSVNSIGNSSGGITLSEDGTKVYVGSTDSKIHIIDITIPSAPILQQSATTEISPYALVTSGDGTKAYVATPSRLSVVDILNLPDPSVYVAFLETNMNTFGITLSNDGTKAYMAEYSAGLLITDISDPSSPHLLASLDTDGETRDVTLSLDGTKAYIADGPAGLKIIDISDPSSPHLLGALDTDGHATSVVLSADGTKVYLSDSDKGLKIIDIHNAASPSLLGSLDTDGYATGMALSEDGRYLYLADYEQGMKVIDVNNSTSPTLIASLENIGHVYNITLSRDNTKAYLANDTMTIVDISNPAAPSVLGSVNDISDTSDLTLSSDGFKIFAAAATKGVYSIDVSNPNMPTLINKFNTNNATCIDISNDATKIFIGNHGGGLQVLDTRIDTLHLPKNFGDGNITLKIDSNVALDLNLDVSADRDDIIVVGSYESELSFDDAIHELVTIPITSITDRVGKTAITVTLTSGSRVLRRTLYVNVY